MQQEISILMLYAWYFNFENFLIKILPPYK